MQKGKPYLRAVVSSDMEILFEWANDPVVRGNSFHSEPISYEVHKSWFKHMMEDASVHQFILMDNGIPIGQIRLNVYGDEAEIGYSIAKEFRGNGYGRMILQLAAEEVRANHPEIGKLVAKVKSDNTMSRRLFESEGYRYRNYEFN